MNARLFTKGYYAMNHGTAINFKNLPNRLACVALLLMGSAGAIIATQSNPAVAAQRAGSTALTIYTDYQCSTCKRFESTIKGLQAKYGSAISLRFRNFPLTKHRNGLAAAYAAEAAASQGKLSQMQDQLYANQAEWAYSSDPTGSFVQFAKSLDLDISKFTADLQSPSIRGKVASDISAANAAGIHETPTVVLNGRAIAGAELANLDQLLESAQ